MWERETSQKNYKQSYSIFPLSYETYESLLFRSTVHTQRTILGASSRVTVRVHVLVAIFLSKLEIWTIDVRINETYKHNRFRNFYSTVVGRRLNIFLNMIMRFYLCVILLTSLYFFYRLKMFSDYHIEDSKAFHVVALMHDATRIWRRPNTINGSCETNSRLPRHSSTKRKRFS